MRYAQSQQGSATKEASFGDIKKRLSKSDDTVMVHVVAFFTGADDKAFEQYEEAGESI